MRRSSTAKSRKSVHWRWPLIVVFTSLGGFFLDGTCFDLLAAEGTKGSLRLQVSESRAAARLPARVHLSGPDGTAVKAPGLPFFRDHFNCDGEVTLQLDGGLYEYTVERGPEYRRVRGKVTVVPGKETLRRVTLKRIVDLSQRGWWSGDLHIHRQVADVSLLMRSEDLHVGPVLTVWNQRNLWARQPLPDKLLVEVERDRWMHILSCEDERGGGALLYFNLRQPLDFRGDGREYPSPLKHLDTARARPHVWIDIEKPFWWDVPTWVATGRIDSIGIANNHMCRSTVYPGEAWGRSRDERRLPAPLGNGFYSQELYYRLLNCGFRIPPSAGSASGVLPNPVGYNRVYVHLDGPLTYASWWKGLAAGRSFLTNGPLLLARANGRHPGSVFRVKAGDELLVDFDVELFGDDPIKALEVVVSGKVVQRIEAPPARGGVRLAQLALKESGWFLIRALSDVAHTFRFASTAPYFVEAGEVPKRIHRSDVEFFMAWIKERMKRLSVNANRTIGDVQQPENEAKLESVLRPHQRALEVFEALLEEAAG